MKLLNLIIAGVTQIHFPNVIYFDSFMERHENWPGGPIGRSMFQTITHTTKSIILVFLDNTRRRDRFEVANLMTF